MADGAGVDEQTGPGFVAEDFAVSVAPGDDIERERGNFRKLGAVWVNVFVERLPRAAVDNEDVFGAEFEFESRRECGEPREMLGEQEVAGGFETEADGFRLCGDVSAEEHVIVVAAKCDGVSLAELGSDFVDLRVVADDVAEAYEQIKSGARSEEGAERFVVSVNVSDE